MTSAVDEEKVPSKALQITEMLLRTDVGKSFFIETTNAEETRDIMRAVHSRAANLKRVNVTVRARALRAIEDADPAIPGDEDKLLRMVRVMILSRAVVV